MAEDKEAQTRIIDGFKARANALMRWLAGAFAEPRTMVTIAVKMGVAAEAHALFCEYAAEARRASFRGWSVLPAFRLSTCLIEAYRATLQTHMKCFARTVTSARDVAALAAVFVEAQRQLACVAAVFQTLDVQSDIGGPAVVREMYWEAMTLAAPSAYVACSVGVIEAVAAMRKSDDPFEPVRLCAPQPPPSERDVRSAVLLGWHLAPPAKRGEHAAQLEARNMEALLAVLATRKPSCMKAAAATAAAGAAGAPAAPTQHVSLAKRALAALLGPSSGAKAGTPATTAPAAPATVEATLAPRGVGDGGIRAFVANTATMMEREERRARLVSDDPASAGRARLAVQTHLIGDNADAIVSDPEDGVASTLQYPALCPDAFKALFGVLDFSPRTVAASLAAFEAAVAAAVGSLRAAPPNTAGGDRSGDGGFVAQLLTVRDAYARLIQHAVRPAHAHQFHLVLHRAASAAAKRHGAFEAALVDRFRCVLRDARRAAGSAAPKEALAAGKAGLKEAAAGLSLLADTGLFIALHQRALAQRLCLKNPPDAAAGGASAPVATNNNTGRGGGRGATGGGGRGSEKTRGPRGFEWRALHAMEGACGAKALAHVSLMLEEAEAAATGHTERVFSAFSWPAESFLWAPPQSSTNKPAPDRFAGWNGDISTEFRRAASGVARARPGFSAWVDPSLSVVEAEIEYAVSNSGTGDADAAVVLTVAGSAVQIQLLDSIMNASAASPASFESLAAATGIPVGVVSMAVSTLVQARFVRGVTNGASEEAERRFVFATDPPAPTGTKILLSTTAFRT